VHYFHNNTDRESETKNLSDEDQPLKPML
jgi:hypothetical protein